MKDLVSEGRDTVCSCQGSHALSLGGSLSCAQPTAIISNACSEMSTPSAPNLSRPSQPATFGHFSSLPTLPNTPQSPACVQRGSQTPSLVCTARTTSLPTTTTTVTTSTPHTGAPPADPRGHSALSPRNACRLHSISTRPSMHRSPTVLTASKFTLPHLVEVASRRKRTPVAPDAARPVRTYLPCGQTSLAAAMNGAPTPPDPPRFAVGHGLFFAISLICATCPALSS